MRKFVAVVLVLVAATASSQPARANNLFGQSGPLVKTAAVNTRGNVVSSTTRLQPVIGSVQRTSHFTNPFTHKAKYSATMFNPLSGTFATKTLRR